MKTRKMLYSLTKSGRASLRGEHLVPCLETTRQNCFVGVESGKKYEKGYIVYLGKDIDTEEIEEKLRIRDDWHAEARPVIESFLTALQSFKIGNVISVSFVEKDKCVLTKEAEQPIEKHKRRLP
ncbi:MAG: hypothetical protein HGA43_13910 [Nitrospirae bacterium]|nr:hypothetical protein [Nitrospirota bacterium]